MLTDMLAMGGSGGGIDIDFSTYDVFSNNNNLASHAVFDVTVTQKPKFVVVVTVDNSPKCALYLYDVTNNRLTSLGLASTWITVDESSRISTYFPTVSDSQISFYNSASTAKYTGVWCYY